MDILFIIALIITSIISVTFMVERGLALRWNKVVPPEVQAGVVQFRNGADLPRLKGICERNTSPISRLLLFAAEHLDWPKNENADVLETRARHETTQLQRGLVVLEIIVGIAPLLGLVGTIYGLILLFGGMNQVGAEQTATFAQGISLALRATLLGLIIAIPTLVAWSYFNNKVENLAVEMETLCDEFLRKNYRCVAPGSGEQQAGNRRSMMVSMPTPQSPLIRSDSTPSAETPSGIAPQSAASQSTGPAPVTPRTAQG